MQLLGKAAKLRGRGQHSFKCLPSQPGCIYGSPLPCYPSNSIQHTMAWCCLGDPILADPDKMKSVCRRLVKL